MGGAAGASRRLPGNVVLLGLACVATLALAFVASFVEPIWQARYGIVVVGGALVVLAIVAARTRVGHLYNGWISDGGPVRRTSVERVQSVAGA